MVVQCSCTGYIYLAVALWKGMDLHYSGLQSLPLTLALRHSHGLAAAAV